MVSAKTVTKLDEILEAKRIQLAQKKRKTPIDAVRALASMQSRPTPLLSTVTRDEPVLLAGQIRYVPPVDENTLAVDPVAEAVRYARAGLDTISLFTDEVVYSGGMDDLMFVARAVQAFNIPVVTQDYIIDEYQVVEARAAGAAGLVLTACILDQPTLRSLVSSTQRNRMTAIVRVSNEEELRRAIDISPQVIAISDQHPSTGEIERGLAKRLRATIPSHIRVALCDGVTTTEDIIQAVRLNVHAIFVEAPLLRGETLNTLRLLSHSETA